MPLLLAQIAASRGPMAAFVAMGVVWGAFMASMPDLQARMGVGDGQLGQILLFGSVTAIAMMALAPRLGGWLGRWAVPLGTVLMGLGVTLPGQAAAPAVFVGALMVMGGATGALDVWMNARLSTIEAARGMALMNLNHAIYSFAYAGAAGLTGLARAAGFAPVEILGAAGLVVLVLAAFCIEREGRIDGFGRGAGRGGPPPPGSLDPGGGGVVVWAGLCRAGVGGWGGGGGGAGGRAPGRLGMVPWLAGLLILVAFLTENAAEAWSALYIERDLGGGTGAGSAGPALLGLTMGLGRLAGQVVAMRVSDQVLLRGGLVVAALGAIVVVAANGVAMAYAGFMVLGFGASVVVPTALAVAGRLSAPGMRSHAIARATMLGYMGFFLGPPVLGLTAELVGLRASYGLVALALVLGLFLRARLARHER
ncbi:MAG: MFS transporter [Pararhodobacter sp.]|nr:MFS transporter [Pararhodobacter sp.]